MHLTRVDEANPEDVAIILEQRGPGWWIRLGSALVAGARYRLEMVAGCGPASVEFQTTDEVPLPDRLGTVTATSPRTTAIQLLTSSSSCYAPVPAVSTDVDVELAEEAKPWAPLLVYTPLVDGGGWTPDWSEGASQPYDFSGAQTKVFAECSGQSLPSGEPVDQNVVHQGVEEGTHTLSVRASLPGLDRVLQTAEKDVQFACTAPRAGGGASMAGLHAPSSASSGCDVLPRAFGADNGPRSAAAWALLGLIACCMLRQASSRRNMRRSR